MPADWLFHIFNTDLSFTERSPPNRTWYFGDGIWLSIFCNFPNFNLFCWSSLEFGANGDKAWLTVNSLMRPATHMVSISSQSLQPLPPAAFSASQSRSGAKHEHTRKWRIPYRQAKRQSTFFLKSDFLSCSENSPALVGAGPHPCGVSLYFTVGIQTAPLALLRPLFSVNWVL